MNMTIVCSVLFLSFAACIGFIAWLASKGGVGWFLILIGVILFFGSVHFKKEDTATCPQCHHVFKVKVDNE